MKELFINFKCKSDEYKKDPYVVRMAARHQPHASASAPTHQLPSRSERLDGQSPVRKPISVQVEILQGSNKRTAVYTETHELTTTKTERSTC